MLDAQWLTDVTGQELKPIGRNPRPVPSYMRSYGWGRETREMFKDVSSCDSLA